MDLSKTDSNNRITSLIKAFEKQILALKKLIMEIEKNYTEQPENGNDGDQNNKK